MNKTKKELLEENKKLQSIIDTYEEKYGTKDILSDAGNQMKFTRTALWITSAILLVLSAFLIGLAWK